MRTAYICCPLGGDVKANLEKARKYAKYTFECGITPVVPHFYAEILDDSDPKQRECGEVSASSSSSNAAAENDTTLHLNSNYYHADEEEFKSYVASLFDASDYKYSSGSTSFSYAQNGDKQCDKINCEFTFSKGKITLPCTQDDLKNMGLDFSSDKEKETSLSNRTYSYFKFTDNAGLTLNAGIYNVTGEETKASDPQCKVRDLAINGSNETTMSSFKLGNGITEKSSIKDVIAAYGSPQKVRYLYATSGKIPDNIIISYSGNDSSGTKFTFDVKSKLSESTSALRNIEVKSAKNYTISN